MVLVVIGTAVLFIGIALFVWFDLIGKRPERPGTIKVPGFNLSVGSETLILCGLGVVLILAGNAGGDGRTNDTTAATTPTSPTTATTTTTAAPSTPTTSPTTATMRPEECLRQITAAARDAEIGIADVELGPNCTITKVTFVVSSAGDAAAAAAIAANFGADEDDVTIIVEGPEPVVLGEIGPLEFAVADDALTMEAEADLDEVARYLEEQPDDDLAIHGHTDSTGTATSNLELSQRRAEAARRYLVEENEVDADRVSAIGFGEGEPIAPNATAAGRQANRRIELLAGEGAAHVVERADTLSAIAATYYGDAARWPELFRANRSRLAGPDVLVIGTSLIIPPSR